MKMTASEIKNRIAILEGEINEKEKEVKQLKKDLKSIDIKNPWLVRIYINSGKRFKTKRFRTAEAAEKFVKEKCGFEFYEGYFNMGTTISFLSEENPEDGEFYQLAYPITQNSEYDLRNFKIYRYYEGLLQAKQNIEKLKFSLINTSYHVKQDNKDEREVFTRSVKRLIGSLKSSKYFKDLEITADKFRNPKVDYEEFLKVLPSFLDDIINEKINIPSVQFYHNKENGSTIVATSIY